MKTSDMVLIWTRRTRQVREKARQRQHRTSTSRNRNAACKPYLFPAKASVQPRETTVAQWWWWWKY